MADDLVARLRGWPCMGLGDPTACHLCDAADGIERLTEWRKNALLALDKREAEIERLRALCNDLYHDATCAESFCRLCGEGIREWEAHRG